MTSHTSIRPMLAGKAPTDLDQLRFPLLASPKLDGIRCLIKDGQAVSRTLKPIRNRHVQRLLGDPRFEGLDGELIVGSPTAPNCMQHTSSGVMSAAGEPNFRFYVFDYWRRGKQPFAEIISRLSHLVGDLVLLHTHSVVYKPAELEELEGEVLSSGYEGLILRDPLGPYKFNRSTTREQWMLKLKRFDQSEAVVIGYEELMHNLNDLTEDERGYAKRSTAQAGKIPSGKLGALICQQLDPSLLPIGPPFNIGTGFDDAQRKLLWSRRQTLPGRIVTFKHFAQQGVLKAPRHPVFIAFRDPIDL